MFVDISGFTALSEKLARRGRVGAEELTETLSSVFADLLTSAYAAGGSLLKFGGDALLLLFHGHDHALRAATTAIQMRHTLANRGPIHTDGGSIRLRMSVGVHSGELHFFRVGESHKELLVTGPGTSAVCDMESAAVAGQIMVSPGTAEALPRRLLSAVNGPGVLLKRARVEAIDSGYPQVPSTKVDLSDLVPIALREALLDGVEPEHRLTTIAFVHFDGIDGFIAQHGAAAAAEALHELVVEAQEAADGERVTFLGTDLDHDGGKIILVGGAPRAFGDDEGRVLRAVRRIVDAGTQLPVRVGINRGHVFVGEVGPPYRKTYTVMGDTVNLAARLMAKAMSGQIIATAEVLDNAQTLFEQEALPPFYVKGKTNAINAFSVGASRGRRRRAGSDPLPFVGRDSELTALTDAWAAARTGRGGFVGLFGDAGIGKSRLVREFANHADDVRTITAFCETYQTTTPYFAVRYLLRGALGLGTEAATGRGLRAAVERLDPALLPWLPLIGAVAAIEVPSTPEVDDLEPQFRRARTVGVIVDLLTKALPHPVVLFVDDSHWLDELSGELLAGLATVARKRPWIVLLAGRVEVGSYAPSEEALDVRIALSPLDQSEASALLTSADQASSMRPDQREAILARSGGNPLFLEQLAARTGEAELPDSLEALVGAEIDALDSRDRTSLRVAAVLGPIFDTALLLRLVDAPSSESLLATGVGRFLEPVNQFTTRFRNQTYRDVAYETLSFGRRRDLHGRALDAIEQTSLDLDEDADVLSFHALHARDFERCWTYSRTAAESARDNYANVQAAALYERAIAAAAQLRSLAPLTVARTWELLGEVSRHAGMFDAAKRAFDKARLIGPADDNAFQARLCFRQAVTALERGQASSVTRWLNRGLALVALATDEDGVRVRSDLRTTFAEALQRRRRNVEAMELASLAAEDARACGSKASLARAMSVRGMAALDIGAMDEVDVLEDALILWEAEGSLQDEATVATLLGAVAYFKGDWDDAAAYFRRAETGFERAGNVVAAGYGTCNLADILIDQGRGAEVVDGVREVIRVWRSVGHPDPVAGALVNVGRCALETGDLEEAVARFTEAHSLTTGGTSARVLADYWLAECGLRAGDGESTLASATELIGIEEALGGTYLPQLHRLRGLAYATLGRFDDAIADEETSLRIARERGAAFEVAQAVLALDACHAALGSRADAELRDEAYATLKRLGVRDVQLPLPPAA